MNLSIYKQSNNRTVFNTWSLFHHKAWLTLKKKKKKEEEWSVDEAAVKLWTERKHNGIITSTNTDQQTRHTHVLTVHENKEIFIERT